MAIRFRFIPDDTKFGFMQFRSWSFPFSALLSVLTVLVFFGIGVNFGIDFKGGTLVELQAKAERANIEDVRAKANALNFGAVEVQEFGTPREVLLRVELQVADTPALQEQAQQNVVTRLKRPSARITSSAAWRWSDRASRTSSCRTARSASSSASSACCCISGSASSGSSPWAR